MNALPAPAPDAPLLHLSLPAAGSSSPAARELALQEPPPCSVPEPAPLAAAAAEGAGPLAQVRGGEAQAGLPVRRICGVQAPTSPLFVQCLPFQPFRPSNLCCCRTAPHPQGLFAPGAAAAPRDAGFTPLASGLGASTFATGTGFQQGWQAAPGASAAAAGDRQRRQLRQAAAWRLASGRQGGVGQSHRGSLDAGPSAGGTAPAAALEAAAAAGADASAAPSHPPPGSVFSSLHWQPALAPAAGHPFSFTAQPPVQQSHQPPLPQQAQLAVAAAAAVPFVAPAPQPAPPLLQQHAAAPPPGSQAGGSSAARCSTGQDMETDLRSSWGSELSADVAPWQALQARLRAQAGAPLSASHPALHGDDEEEEEARRLGFAAGLPRGASTAALSEADAAMRGSAEGAPSVDGAPSTRSSLDGPACSERQTSQLPLRAAMRSAQWHSHLASPAAEGGSPDALLGRSSGSSRQRSRGSNPVRQPGGAQGSAGLAGLVMALRA